MAAAKRSARTSKRPKRGRSATKPAAAAALPVPEPGSRIWVLDEVPFKTTPPGATYSQALRSMIAVGPDLPAGCEPYRSKDYSMARWIEDDLNGEARAVQELPEMKPRTDQLVQIAKIIRADTSGQRAFLLTSDTGTGKTLVSVRAARKIAARRAKGRPGRILVLANRPAALCIPDYRRTIQAAGGTEHRWLVTTVDRVHKAAELAVDWDVVIVDESHGYRSPTTRRSKSRVKVTKALNSTVSRVPFVLDMTATPAHDPTEMTYLAPLLAHRTGTKTKDWYDDFSAALEEQGLHFTSGRYGREWTEDPVERATDIAWMRATLEREPPVTAYQAAPWGPAPLDVAAIDFDPARQAQYEADWQEYVAEMGLARKVGRGDKGRAAMLRWRQKALHLRVPDIAEWAASQVELGKQVVLYTDFVSMGAEPLVEHLDGAGVRAARLFGTESNLAAELDDYATGAAPVAVTTMTASINLHAGAVMPNGIKATSVPRVGAMTAPMYSGIKGRQVIGRTHRDHQVSPWLIMTAGGTVEEKVARTMIGRFAASDGLAGADTSALQQVAQLLGASWMDLSDLDASDPG